MSVSTTTNRVVYSGNGSSTSFAFGYYFTAKSDLSVYKYDTLLGGITTLVLAVDYTITGTANSQGLYPSGGTVVCTVAPLATDQIVIVRAPSFVQNYSLLQNGTISSAALVQEFDYLTLIVQRLEDQVSRALILPDGFATNFSTTLPVSGLTANQSITINSGGTGFALGPTPAQLAAANVAAAAAAASATAAAASASAASGSATAAAASATTAGVWAAQAAASAMAAGGVPNLVGTRAAPISITAAGGITSSAQYAIQLQFIQGSGGPITVTANPQITNGTFIGQSLILKGRDDTNTVTLINGNALSMNGDVVLGNDDEIVFWWDGTLWQERNRRR